MAFIHVTSASVIRISIPFVMLILHESNASNFPIHLNGKERFDLKQNSLEQVESLESDIQQTDVFHKNLTNNGMNFSASYRRGGSRASVSATTLRSTSLCDVIGDIAVYTRVIPKLYSIFSPGYVKCLPLLNRYLILCAELSSPCTGCCLSSIGALGCISGECPTGYTCITVDCNNYKLSCEPGFYSTGRTQCRDCANSKPLEATFIPGGLSATCLWNCNPGFFKSGESCQRCPNEVPTFGSYIRNCTWVCNSGYAIEHSGIGLGTVCKVMPSSSKINGFQS
jgi:hypothetical protein